MTQQLDFRRWIWIKVWRTSGRRPYLLSEVQDRNYDVTADGQRFLMVQQADPSKSTVRLNIVVNWLDELKPKVR